ncbi:MAG: hypothetical protein ACI4LT_09540, partial [Treponema sp.]
MSENRIISNIYHLRKNFAIIGLTGRTGAGCTTIANLFKCEKFEDLHAPDPSEEHEGISNDERKYKVIYNFAKTNWKSFTVITASDIIFYFVLSLEFDDFIESIVDVETQKTKKEDEFRNSLHQKLDFLKSEFEKYSELVSEIDEFLEKRESYFLRYAKEDSNVKETCNKIKKYKEFIFQKIPSFRKKLAEAYREKMFRVYQSWGNNIRKYGSAVKKSQNDEISTLARKINAIIKMLEDENIYTKNPTFIVIDAIRNPYEVLYFKERFAAFYLMSVTSNNEIRKNNLYKQDYKDSEIKNLDEEEYPKNSKTLKDSY